MKTIAIIGAGPMGLATAYHLARAGHTPVVLEKDTQTGGMSASFDFDGVRLEKYYHFINRPDQDLFDLLHELGMEGELRWTCTRMGFFRFNSRMPSGVGHMHPWGNPLALLSFPDVSLLTRLRYGLHALHCKYLNNLMRLDSITASEWLRAWVGNEGYAVLWKFLFEKKFFSLAEPLSAAWIASRVRRVARSRKNLMQEELGYLEGGSESLISRLMTEIARYGGVVRTGCPVYKVGLEGNNFTLNFAHDGVENLQADAVISTIPLPYVNDIFPFLPPAYANRISQVRNVGVACALFRLQKPLSTNFWINIDMPDWDIPGIIEYSNLRPMKAAYIYIPFYMPHSHTNWQADDGQLLVSARQCLASINPEAAATEEAARIFRYEYAQPVCPPGFQNILPPCDTGIPRLFIADTAHSFPEDRSIQESVRIGRELATQALLSLSRWN